MPGLLFGFSFAAARKFSLSFLFAPQTPEDDSVAAGTALQRFTEQGNQDAEAYETGQSKKAGNETNEIYRQLCVPRTMWRLRERSCFASCLSLSDFGETVPSSEACLLEKCLEPLDPNE